MLPLSGIHAKKGYIDDLEKVQRRTTILPQNISHLSYTEGLAALILPTVGYRRIRGDMIETFKILSNIYDSRVTNFLSKNNFSTSRGHKFKLFIQHENFNIRKWFFSIRIVDIWNRLPSSVAIAPSVICLEKRLNKCWADLKMKFWSGGIVVSTFVCRSLGQWFNSHSEH